MRHLKHLIALLFYVFIIGVMTYGHEPAQMRTDPQWLSGLLSGTNEGYPELASEMAPLKRILPKRGAISYLTDLPYEEETLRVRERYRMAQGFMAPLLLNPEPSESYAIVIATNMERANHRLAQTGYKWVSPSTTGKGLARKK
jgi:hypothetical protein